MDTAQSRISQIVAPSPQTRTKPHILVLEDDHAMGKAIATTLKECGFIVDWVDIPEKAINRLRADHFDLILLEWQLPGQTGGEFLSLIRKFSKIPIVIETRNSGLDVRLKALEMGADDVLTKPFVLKELCARIKAILRRTYKSRDAGMIQVGDVLLNPANNSITQNGKTVPMEAKEMEFIRLLLQIPGKPVSKEIITRVLFSYRKNNNPSRCEVFVFRMRKKLGMDFIRCRYGEGYYIDPTMPYSPS